MICDKNCHQYKNFQSFQSDSNVLKIVEERNIVINLEFLDINWKFIMISVLEIYFNETKFLHNPCKF